MLHFFLANTISSVDRWRIVPWPSLVCKNPITKRDLVNQGELTGEKGYVTTFHKTLLISAPIAKIEVDTQYYVGEVKALCVWEPVADLNFGKITGAR